MIAPLGSTTPLSRPFLSRISLRDLVRRSRRGVPRVSIIGDTQDRSIRRRESIKSRTANVTLPHPLPLLRRSRVSLGECLPLSPPPSFLSSSPQSISAFRGRCRRRVRVSFCSAFDAFFRSLSRVYLARETLLRLPGSAGIRLNRRSFFSLFGFFSRTYTYIYIYI